MGAGRLPLVRANGSSVCDDDHDNDRRRARNGEADAVDVAGSINPQFDPGPVVRILTAGTDDKTVESPSSGGTTPRSSPCSCPAPYQHAFVGLSVSRTPHLNSERLPAHIAWHHEVQQFTSSTTAESFFAT
ncbi:hypothetical protein OPT61_g2590 [Boeremia exigua]|uniref:Uncharacterized protein n=1 Tax=Boeremia exigua TaxID=749465 RepID=A0ACC2IL13_9PLEO|nr:hypothetical protein OPT61_g2590 [Boeremia exigua]